MVHLLDVGPARAMRGAAAGLAALPLLPRALAAPAAALTITGHTLPRPEAPAMTSPPTRAMRRGRSGPC